MTCQHCEQSAARPVWGGYDTRCAHCCARLILSARPMKHAQEAMFAAMDMRRPDTPSKEAVLLALRELDANKTPLPMSGMNP